MSDDFEICKHKWILVTERLPEEKGFYLCYAPHWVKMHVYKFSDWGNQGRKRFWNDGGTETSKITHWMPLPSPPELPKC